jgi:DNA replication and repair protein RecF
MRLGNLVLINFKNYIDCSFTFSPGLNFIYGDNGNGKTNILEAISFMCYTKSFLQNSEADCIKYGENEFNLTGNFYNSVESEFRIKMNYSSAGAVKCFVMNSERISRLNDILGLFPLVTLSPYDLKLTTGSPHERRRNFDLLISQTSRIYLDDLRSLSRVLKQKNALLKENLFSKKYSYDDLKQMIKGWNNELIKLSLKVVVRRLDFIENFRTLLAGCFKDLVSTSYEPAIDIESDLLSDVNDNPDLDTMRENFKKRLEEKCEEEIKRGISLLGPHRDNYIFKMKKGNDIFDVRTFASQGEHKVFLIALKLAEFKYIKQFSEGSFKGDPIFILDDVFSELDGTKVNRVCEILPGYNQLFITSTDKEYLNKLGHFFPAIDTSSFEIVNGGITNAA